MMPDNLFALTGLLPAVIFPVAASIQLIRILRTGKAEGVSPLSWFLFALANISLFVYAEKYGDLFTIIALLGTACINLCIVVLALRFRSRP